MSRIARLGAFIFASLIAFSAGVFLIGQKDFLFSDTVQLLSQFDNVAGLMNGAPVRVGGVHVGTVEGIRMPGGPDEKVVVVMNLKKDAINVIRKDSVAAILTEGLLGDKFVTISPGSQDAMRVKSGDVIQGIPPVDLSDLIQKSGEVLDRTKVTLANLEATTDHFKSISTKIDSGQGTMGRLVNDGAIYNHLNQTVANANRTVAKAQEGVTSFQENMEALKGNFFIRGFFKKRGYADSSELTKNEIPELPTMQAIKTFTSYTKDLFDKPATAKLKNEKLLRTAGEFLQENTYRLVAVTARTSFQGEKEKNLEISRAQAMVVRKYLVDNFKIDDSRVLTKGMGEDERIHLDKAGEVQILVYN